ncbi:2-hydroxyacid dehydrogenase [Halopelagius fulvigenes]|uniref:2-hydroxyacid dehydrogenase n=1 Tax=Halopelagius fulvigenes TaxID=1198324 RepID=A0ABD5U0I5_9EURY
MSLHIVLIGGIAAGAKPILEEQIEVPATFRAISDSDDEEDVLAVLTDADIVLGDWPAAANAMSAPDLKLMQRVGAGVDKIDPERIPPGAYVCNVYKHSTAIAEHVFSMLLAHRRRLLELDADLRNGVWNYPRPPEGSVSDIRGSTLGIVGFGHIGRALVPRARGFDLDVMAIRGSEPTDDLPDGVTFLGGPDDLDRVLEECDVIVVSVPLNDETRGLIGEREFELMGADSMLINVARGPVVDEAAFYEALESETIGGAGIDTWYRYPNGDESVQPSEFPFTNLDNVVLTPHIAGWSDQTASARFDFIAENVARIARGEKPENVVWGPRA